MDSKLILGTNIQRYRLFRGLDQKELAARAGMSAQAISKIERGIENVALDNLIMIAKALDVTLEELACQDSDKLTLKIVLSKENAETIKNALAELGKVIKTQEGG
jgi:transcriptional regulator with XRE-family HTH domain